ncbi:snare associated Golgi protein-domain-containing protein [Halteromyces radiatus]|uniref:snare associated Golgi protein-domain-containing protein n=1 Tax=Halteromyces radiatus TaxID=101107 RepID=UPI00221E8441|nr:snare associated Golgi protein-domain-containing protein [Halteromyces radiatus]KAI8078691.1 snare associated Golgi protein-domain-containing protein [Halteromyces radiatus]
MSVTRLNSSIHDTLNEFGEEDDDKRTVEQEEQEEQYYPKQYESGWQAWQRLVPRLALFASVGAVSLYLLIQLTHLVLNIDLPHTLQDVQSIATQLDTMTHEGTWWDYVKVVMVFAAIYVWQQGFSMPGCVLLNLLSGHLYGVVAGSLWTSYLTGLGSTLAYFFGWLVGQPAMEMAWIRHRADLMREQMEKERKSTGLFWWLLFARLFPFSPYWFINLASPLLGISVVPFFWSTFLGSLPYNFVCAQAGEVLGELSSTSDILTVSLMIKLLLVSLISLIPIFWGKTIQRKLRGWIQQRKEDEEMELDRYQQHRQTSLGYVPVSTHIN